MLKSKKKIISHHKIEIIIYEKGETFINAYNKLTSDEITSTVIEFLP